MVIIPTEKRFDWKHAPFVLFSIVFINVFIFFVYQAGDNEKLMAAFSEYKTQQFLDLEWPFFKQYLTENGNEDQLEKYQTLYDNQQYDELIINIILQRDFFRYLRIDQYDYFSSLDNDVGDWFEKREQIDKGIGSTSASSLGLIPSDLSIITLFSHQFLHGRMMHLLGNLFFLIVCGFAVEAAVGHWRFLSFYLVCGLTGGLLHTAFNLKTSIPLVGASGAISGVMAMYLGLFRLKKIEFFYWFFIFVGYFRAPALLILVFYLGKEIIQFYTDTGSNVAFMAHVGGFIGGAILMAIVYYLKPAVFNQTYIEEDQSINPMQEKLATVYDFIGKYQFEAAEKALNRIAADNTHFECLFLRYNLVKVRKNKDYLTCVQQLLSTPNPNDYEVKRMERVWLENQNHHEILDENTIIKLGMHFAKLEQPNTAAAICDSLVDSQCSNDALGLLARKISIAYETSANMNKKKYEAITESLLAGVTQ